MDISGIPITEFIGSKEDFGNAVTVAIKFGEFRTNVITLSTLDVERLIEALKEGLDNE